MLCKPCSFWLTAAVLSLAASFSLAADTGQKTGIPPENGTAATQIPAEESDPRRELLAEHRRLEDKLAAAVADSANAARAFGQLLPAEERRRLQTSCSTLARNPDNSRARGLLREFFERYRDQEPRIIARYCFDPSLRQLQQEVRATRNALQAQPANGGEFDFQYQRLERAAQGESRRYAAIRSILLAGQGDAGKANQPRPWGAE